eukprot:scaffold23135_cov19-Tisochrysis_lutea.AAC.1
MTSMSNCTRGNECPHGHSETNFKSIRQLRALNELATPCCPHASFCDKNVHPHPHLHQLLLPLMQCTHTSHKTGAVIRNVTQSSAM